MATTFTFGFDPQPSRGKSRNRVFHNKKSDFKSELTFKLYPYLAGLVCIQVIYRNQMGAAVSPSYSRALLQ